MAYKTEFQSNNADLQSILNTINSLPEATSIEVETSTVTVSCWDFGAYYTINALIFENNEILAIEEYFMVDDDSSYVLQNVIRNSIITIKSDGSMAGSGISGTLDFGDGDIRNENYYVIGTFFSTQIIDENAEINVSTAAE